jgi:hypothetical protein
MGERALRESVRERKGKPYCGTARATFGGSLKFKAARKAEQ